MLAQLDRVTGYEPVGRGFESLTAHQKETTIYRMIDCRFFLFSSLFSILFSLFSHIAVSREKIRENREEKMCFAKQSVDLKNEL